MRDTGIVRMSDRWKLGYGWHHGFGRGWLPNKVQRAFVHWWNALACQLVGHDWFPDFGTATYTEQPCVCGPDLTSIEAHPATHDMPSNWTHELCTSCRARREARS